MVNPSKLATAQRAARRSVRVSRAEAQANPLPPALAEHQHVREDELRVTLLGNIGPTKLRELMAEEADPLPGPIRLSPRVLIWHVPSVLAWLESRRADKAQAAVQASATVHDLPRKRRAA